MKFTRHCLTNILTKVEIHSLMIRLREEGLGYEVQRETIGRNKYGTFKATVSVFEFDTVKVKKLFTYKIRLRGNNPIWVKGWERVITYMEKIECLNNGKK